MTFGMCFQNLFSRLTVTKGQSLINITTSWIMDVLLRSFFHERQKSMNESKDLRMDQVKYVEESLRDICDNLSYRKIISILVEKPLKICYIKTWTQPTFIYSRSRIETVEQCLKYVQSYICKFYFDKTKLFDRCLPTTKNTYVPG